VSDGSVTSREELPEGFDIEDLGDRWLLRCPTCGRDWRLLKYRLLQLTQIRDLAAHLTSHRPTE
jgi:hypothetical protein